VKTMHDTWTQTKSPRMFRLRRGEYTVIVRFLVNSSATLRIYRKGSLRSQDLCLRYEDVFDGAEAALNQAIAEDAAPSSRRPALLISVPFGRYKYVDYYLRRKGYVDKFPRRQGDAPLVIGEAGTAVVDEVVAHLKAIAPGVVVV